MISCLTVLSVAVSAQERKPDEVGFQHTLQPLMRKYCVTCHGAEDPEGKLSLQTISPDLFAAGNLEAWRLIYDQVRFGDMPPQDADPLPPADRLKMLRWIRRELLKTQLPGVVADPKLQLPRFGNYVDHQFLFETRLSRVYPAAPRVWRLRPDIYASRMRNSQLSESRDALDNGLNVLDGAGIKDYAAAYFIDESGAAPLLGNAKRLAAAMLDAKRGKSRELKALTGGEQPPDRQTVVRAIDAVFSRALGRQPTTEERQRFGKFYEVAKASADHEIAAQALVTAILMQPEFFFRSELGDGALDAHGRRRLSQTEIAYALSYALDDTPDGDLLKLARDGKLDSSAAVAAAVRQRLTTASPRITQFFREYFHYTFASEVFKDQPPGGEHNAGMLIADLETTIAPILQQDRDVLRRLLTTRKFYVNAEYKTDKQGVTSLQPRQDRTRRYQTAFNLPIDWKWGAHLQPVEFAVSERAGVLTHPAWLAAWSGNFENHPVQRGKWIRTHLLGGSVPDVPIGVDARVPEREHTTFRERLRLATAAAECWRCHKNMDPLGVPFERYDHYGRYQRLDAGQQVDVTGRIDRTGIAELDGIQIGGPTEMMEILARSQHVEQVFTRYAFRYFMGRNETLGDANALQDAHQAYRESKGSFQALVVSLLASDSFLYREIPQPVPELLRVIDSN